MVSKMYYSISPFKVWLVFFGGIYVECQKINLCIYLHTQHLQNHR